MRDGWIFLEVFIMVCLPEACLGLDGDLLHQRKLLGELSVMELPFSISKCTTGWGRTLYL